MAEQEPQKPRLDDRVQARYQHIDQLSRRADPEILRRSLKQLLDEIRQLRASSIMVDTFREQEILDRILGVLRGGPTTPPRCRDQGASR